MSTSVSRVITLEELRSVPLFASLDDKAASELRNLLELREVPGGTTLFRLGDTGDSMYLIERGRVRISVRDADGSDVTLAELAGGDFFGEMALLDGKPRSADTTVIEDAFFAVLSRDNFLKFVRANPDVALRMLSAITHRLRKTDEMLRHRVSRNVNEEEDARLTVGDRLANRIAGFGGSWMFIGLLAVTLILWIAVNSYLIAASEIDPYPYQLFGLVLGVLAGEKDRLRADLDYQVNLKNELSLAEILRRLDVLESERLPILFEKQNRQLLDKMGDTAPSGATATDERREGIL